MYYTTKDLATDKKTKKKKKKRRKGKKIKKSRKIKNIKTNIIKNKKFKYNSKLVQISRKSVFDRRKFLMGDFDHFLMRKKNRNIL